MNIILNGEPRQVGEALTLANLIEQLNLAEKRIAVELNREIVPHGQYETHKLKDGDQVEIVHAIGGGQGDDLIIAGKAYHSRLLVGTGKYKDLEETRLATEASGAQIVTVAIRRSNIGQDPSQPNLLDVLPPERYTILPNTAGCYSV